MNKKINILSTILNSYSQIFFSENKPFAVILFGISFLNIWAGVCGLFAVLVANVTAYILGYNKVTIQKGLYGFNALMVGLGTGVYFQPSVALFVIVFFAALITLFITLAIEGVFTKYGLSYLSIPFLLGMWIIMLSTHGFTALGLSESGLFTYNKLYAVGGQTFVNLYEWFNNIEGYESIKIYFLSLGAIFFQNNILAGVLISIGLLYYSRIAFSLSLLGFYLAYGFYKFIGADFSQLAYTFIGFNYILTSIAIGGYFTIPSLRTYLWTIILLPVTVIISVSLFKVLGILNIALYSLPFNIVVILFMYVLKLRHTKTDRLITVFSRQSSPEKNLYLYRTASAANKGKNYYQINLPFWGEWSVMQAHNGDYTHKDNWKHAWDFVIKGSNGKQYRKSGDFVEDYYCYGKLVLAPQDGIITEIIDGVQDNKIGDINVNQNWGNTIVIKHSELLYSQISHIKEGAFKEKKGEFVKKGATLAQVGNSGHSPYPHLHFQMQATPYVGSQTLDYPLYNYVKVTEQKNTLTTFGKPELDDTISSAEPNPIITDALHFIPGQKLNCNFEYESKKKEYKWEVHKTSFNQTYIYCPVTKSSAYFYANSTGLYFTNFYGNRKSALFIFFSSLYNVKSSFYKDLKISSQIRPNLFYNKFALFFQDFIAPFLIYLKTKYIMRYIEKDDDDFNPEFVKLNSKIEKHIFGNKKNETVSDIIIRNNKTIDIKTGNARITVV